MYEKMTSKKMSRMRLGTRLMKFGAIGIVVGGPVIVIMSLMLPKQETIHTLFNLNNDAIIMRSFGVFVFAAGIGFLVFANRVSNLLDLHGDNWGE